MPVPAGCSPDSPKPDANTQHTAAGTDMSVPYKVLTAPIFRIVLPLSERTPLMRAVTRLILSAVILILTGLLAAVAMYLPEFFFSFYSGFSKTVLTAMANVTGVFPFALWEIGLVLIVLLALYFLFKNRKFFSWLCGIVLLVSILVFLFVGLWGLNHFNPVTVADHVGLEVTEYSRDQLKATTQYMAAQANAWADQVERDADGSMTVDFSGWAEIAGDGYDA